MPARLFELIEECLN